MARKETAILKGNYSDMGIKVLGTTVNQAKKAFREDFFEEYYWPDAHEFYDRSEIKLVKEFLLRPHADLDELKDDYNNTFDNDFIFELV